MSIFKRLDFKISLVVIVAMFLSSTSAIWLYSTQSLIFVDQLKDEKISKLKQVNAQYLKLNNLNKGDLVKQFNEVQEALLSSGNNYFTLLLDEQFNVIKSFLPKNHLVELVRTDIESGFYAVTISSQLKGSDLITIYQRVPGNTILFQGKNYLVVTVPAIPQLAESFTVNSIWPQFSKHIGTFSVLFSLMVLLTIFIIFRSFKSLRKLEFIAQELSSNKIPQQISEVDESEIGKLVIAFNHASQKLTMYQQQREQMTSDIAHELRTPITNMLGRIEAYDEGIIVNESDVIQFLSHQLTGLANIVEDMQLLNSADTKSLALHCSPLSLSEYFESWVKQHSVENEVSFDLNVENVVWNLDNNRLTQIFDNLLANAKNAKPVNLKVNITVIKTSEAITIIFEDNGPGVEPVHLPLLFERLYRADNSRTLATGGSGLGLSIVRTLIETQNGEVNAYINSNKGLGIKIIFH